MFEPEKFRQGWERNAQKCLRAALMRRCLPAGLKTEFSRVGNCDSLGSADRRGRPRCVAQLAAHLHGWQLDHGILGSDWAAVLRPVQTPQERASIIGGRGSRWASGVGRRKVQIVLLPPTTDLIAPLRSPWQPLFPRSR